VQGSCCQRRCGSSAWYRRPPTVGRCSIATYSLLLAATAPVDRSAPPETASRWRRFGCVLVENRAVQPGGSSSGTADPPSAALTVASRAGDPPARGTTRPACEPNGLGRLRGQHLPCAWPDHLGDFPNLLIVLSGAVCGGGHFEPGHRSPGARARGCRRSTISCASRLYRKRCPSSCGLSRPGAPCSSGHGRWLGSWPTNSGTGRRLLRHTARWRSSSPNVCGSGAA